MCRRALLTKTGQPSITASQLRNNMSRGLHHRDRRSVSCCMSACTIVIVDQCLDVCQQIQYKLLYEVILEAYSSRGHRSMCCCMSTYTIMIVDQCVVVCQPTPSWLGISVLLYVNRCSTSSFTRSFSRPTPVVTPDWPWDSWTASFLQTLTLTNPTRGPTTNSRYWKDTVLFVHTEVPRDYVYYKRLFLVTEQSGFFRFQNKIT